MYIAAKWNDPERKAENMKTLIDPVCGMTVDESALRVEGYDDVAFCSPGCRTAFLADPDGYPRAAASVSAPLGDESPGPLPGLRAAQGIE